MRIVIEIEGVLQQPLVTVTLSAASPQMPGAVQLFSSDTIDAGQAPASLENTVTSNSNASADTAMSMAAQPGKRSAGAAPDIATT
ncbi:MAG: hypothetical protein U0Z53_23140 [Blastocatellia bacterium]